jgi:Carboxypeptidase regulatory-like domain
MCSIRNLITRVAAFCLAIALFALAPVRSTAQATTGQIIGQVTDSTGAVVPGAKITATDENRGIVFTGVTDHAGNYTLLSVPPGVYSVTAAATGFADDKVEHATLVIDQHMALDFKLSVAAASSTVEVTAAPPPLQTQSAEVGTVISGDAIVDIPLAGRDFYQLTMLVPGVSQVTGSINSFALSVSGQREFGNSIQLDGIETTTNRTQDVTVTPNVDSVEEFKVTTATYNAEFGNAAGGVIAVQTKSGTNRIHGDAFEFYRPNFLTAKTTLPGVSTPQPAATLKQHNFGGTLGGPIKRDRAFLFGAYEGIRMKNAYSYVYSTIPFGLFNVNPNGDVDFSRLLDPYANKPGGAGTDYVDPIFDPNVSVVNYGWYSQQFPGNIIPASRVSKAGLNTMMNFFPKPNLTGIDNGWFRNYEVYSPVSDDSNKADARFDLIATAKDKLYAVYHWQVDDSLVTDPYHGNTAVQGGGDADQANKEHVSTQSISLTADHIFTPTALNEFRFGYVFYHQDDNSLLDGTDYSTKFGVGNVAVPGYAATMAYPQIWMGDGYLAGGSTWKPYHVTDQNYQFSDSFTWVGIARHSMKFGADLRLLNSRPDFSLFPTGFDFFDSYGYAQTSDYSYTYNNYNAYNWAGGSDIADLVLGMPQSVDIGLQFTNPHTQSWNLSFYAQDSFKVTPKLVLNYGLRYEFQDPWTEANNNMSNYDVASGNILIAGRGGASRSLAQARKNDFSPRFGFAYSADPKTVIRAGAAIFYSPENDGREDILTMNAPWAAQAQYSNWMYNGPASNTQLWQYQLDTGVARSTAINIPPTGVLDPSTLPNGKLETTYSENPKMKTGTTGSYNLAVERQLNRTTTLDVAAVGSLSHRLSYQVGDINANPATNGDGLINPYLGKIQYLTDAGASNFTSLQVKLSRQASNSLSYLASYTYSHSLDNGPAPFNLGHINNDEPQNPYNLNSEWASSDSDLRHNFVLSGVYVLPFGRGRAIGSHWGTVTNAVLGGWHFSPVLIMRTGNPVNVVRGTNPNSVLPGLRPNVTGDPTISRDKRNYMQWFNTSAFSWPQSQSGSSEPGNAGRNIVVGPAYVNLDSSLAKDFAIEHYTLQVRAEAFNTSNTVHLSNPDGNFSSGTFGQINSVLNGSNRVAQLAAKFIF